MRLLSLDSTSRCVGLVDSAESTSLEESWAATRQLQSSKNRHSIRLRIIDSESKQIRFTHPHSAPQPVPRRPSLKVARSWQRPRPISGVQSAYELPRRALPDEPVHHLRRTQQVQRNETAFRNRICLPSNPDRVTDSPLIFEARFWSTSSVSSILRSSSKSKIPPEKTWLTSTHKAELDQCTQRNRIDSNRTNEKPSLLDLRSRLEKESSVPQSWEIRQETASLSIFEKGSAQFASIETDPAYTPHSTRVDGP